MRALDKAGSCFLRAVFKRMKELGLNQTTLAQRMEASRPYVSKVLHGDVSITLRTASRFAKALQMDFIPTLVPKESRVGIQQNLLIQPTYTRETGTPFDARFGVEEEGMTL